jgi:hypothetical protein
MPETASPYRSYLEELAQAAAIAHPEFSVQEILQDPPGRCGRAIDRVISLTDEEKSGLAEAWRSTFIAPKS